MGLLSDAAEIYRATKKKKDINWWTEWVCRPPAALLVRLFRDTRVTPNQITLMGLVLATGAAALFVILPNWWGAIVAAVVFELSFVLDCTDGQLARVRNIQSTLGHHLDFVMDEVKAFVIFAAITIRLFRFADTPERAELYLLVGIAGLVFLGAGLTMTTFVRRPEYMGEPADDSAPRLRSADPQPFHAPPSEPSSPSPLALVVKAIEWGARVVVHYPSYILLVALVPPGRLDIYFWAYAVVNALYAARTFLQISSKMGRFA